MPNNASYAFPAIHNYPSLVRTEVLSSTKFLGGIKAASRIHFPCTTISNTHVDLVQPTKTVTTNAHALLA